MTASTTIFQARKIITMNPAIPEATHVAIRDGRILAVGGAEDMTCWPDAERDDRFADKVLMPGFVEGHSHVMEGGIWSFPYVGYFDRVSPDGVSVAGLTSIDAVVERLRAISDAMENPDEILFAWGFDPLYFGGRRMCRADLDRVSTTRPVLVIHASLHIINVNSFSLAKVGIDRTIDLDGVPKDEAGDPQGELRGVAVRLRLLRGLKWNGINEMANAAGVARYARSAVIAGVTTIADLHNELPDATVDVYRAAAADPEFPVRLVPAQSRIGRTPDELIARIAELAASNTDNLRFGIVKIVVDGSIQGFTARLAWPGYHNGADNGLWYTAPGELKEFVIRLHAARIHLHIHTNGNEATEAALDAVEAAQAASYWPDHRHTLQHCQMATPAQFRRIKSLGLCVNLFANHLFYWGEQHYGMTMGPERAARMDAAGTALRMSIPFALHSDAPVTPLAPLFCAWAAANRTTAKGRVLGPDERISVADALTAVTVGPAYTLHMDHLVGSIETGKFADFAVLEEDPFAVPAVALKDVPVWGTVCGGRVFPSPKP